MSARAKVAAAIASAGVLGLGWTAASAQGHPLVQTASGSGATEHGATEHASPPGGAAHVTRPSPAGPTQAGGSAATGTGAASGGTRLADGTYTGRTATHPYGSIAVTVTVKGGAIAPLSEKVSTGGDRRSSAITSRAIPTLRSEIAAADSADVDTVSGATYTSQAYLTSLQSALDQAAR